MDTEKIRPSVVATSSFIAHIQAVSAEVRLWPKWQQLLFDGSIPTADVVIESISDEAGTTPLPAHSTETRS